MSPPDVHKPENVSVDGLRRLCDEISASLVSIEKLDRDVAAVIDEIATRAGTTTLAEHELALHLQAHSREQAATETLLNQLGSQFTACVIRIVQENKKKLLETVGTKDTRLDSLLTALGEEMRRTFIDGEEHAEVLSVLGLGKGLVERSPATLLRNYMIELNMLLSSIEPGNNEWNTMKRKIESFIREFTEQNGIELTKQRLDKPPSDAEIELWNMRSIIIGRELDCNAIPDQNKLEMVKNIEKDLSNLADRMIKQLERKRGGYNQWNGYNSWILFTLCDFLKVRKQNGVRTKTYACLNKILSGEIPCNVRGGILNYFREAKMNAPQDGTEYV